MDPVIGFEVYQRGFTMFFANSPTRQIAVSFAGAFISALLFVSAAVGPLPVA